MYLNFLEKVKLDKLDKKIYVFEVVELNFKMKEVERR